jgi:hypothetical protein
MPDLIARVINSWQTCHITCGNLFYTSERLRTCYAKAFVAILIVPKIDSLRGDSLYEEISILLQTRFIEKLELSNGILWKQAGGRRVRDVPYPAPWE